MERYSLKQISELTKLPHRAIQFYTVQGVVTPEISSGEGRGNPRLYSAYNVLQFMVIKGLTDLGMVVSKIRLIMGYAKLQRELRQYAEKKLHKEGVDYYIKVFKADDGRLKGNWSMLVADQCVLTAEEAGGMDVAVVINIGRIQAGGEK